MLEQFLKLLPSIASHPLAIVGYVCLVGAWLLWVYWQAKSRDFLRALEAIPKGQRERFCRNSGYRVVGYLMPLVSGQNPIIDFYHPMTRRENYPLVDYGFRAGDVERVAEDGACDGHIRAADGGEEQRIHDALRAIPANLPHGDWIRVLMSLHSWSESRGKVLAKQWSATCTEKFREPDFEAA